MRAELSVTMDETGTGRGAEEHEEVSQPDTWQPNPVLMVEAEVDGHGEGAWQNGGRRSGNNAAEIGVGIGLEIGIHGAGGGGGRGESELTDDRHDSAAVSVSLHHVKDGRSSLKENIVVAGDGGAADDQEDELPAIAQSQCHVADDGSDLEEKKIGIDGDGGAADIQDRTDLKEKIGIAGDGGAANGQEGGELPGDAQPECHVADDRSRKEMALAGDGGGADGRQGCLPNTKLLTLVIVEKNGRLLLGRKKRGFGEGYYNGFGGKVEDGEGIRESAARELEEEALIQPLEMTRRGILIFHFDDKPRPWEVHVFHVAAYEGVPGETEEMAPEWFEKDDLPFEKMWADDRYWYPEFLNGRKFWGDFHFRNTHILEHYKLDTF